MVVVLSPPRGVMGSSSVTMAWCGRPVERIGVCRPELLSWSQAYELDLWTLKVEERFPSAQVGGDVPQG